MGRQKSIRLHPEHGLNPTISVCVLCGKDKNEIALLGAAYKGEAPMRMVTSVDPCEDCQKQYLAKGVLMLEATKATKGPAITGRCLVLKDKAYTRLTGEKPHPKKIAFVEPDVFKKLLEESKDGKA